MRYLSIDVETTGLADNCALLELAMVLEDTSKAAETPVDQLPAFRGWVQLDGPTVWEAEAMRMHLGKKALEIPLGADFYRRTRFGYPDALDIETRTKLFVRPPAMNWCFMTIEQLDRRALSWLTEHNIDPVNKITPAGKNFTSFDKRFLPPYIAASLHHRAIDPGGILIDWNADKPPSLTALFGSELQHDSLDDARAVITVLRRQYVPAHVNIEHPEVGTGVPAPGGTHHSIGVTLVGHSSVRDTAES